jgi:FAD:protein FMN transferase
MAYNLKISTFPYISQLGCQFFQSRNRIYLEGEKMELLTRTERHMATDVILSIYCEPQKVFTAKKALESAFGKIHQLEKMISEFHLASPVYKLNRSRGDEKIPISPELFDLLNLSFMLRKKTERAFDPLWRSKGQGNIEWDQNAFWRSNEETILGFGAIGKGYILDKVRLDLANFGMENFILNAGGSSIILSGFAKNRPLDWAWSWQKYNNEYLGKKFFHNNGKVVALGVSGTMEQGFHILDSKGESANESLSALVAHPSAAVADALSTALFVKGWDFFEKLRDPLHEMPMALVDKNLNLYWNGDFKNYWGNPN